MVRPLGRKKTAQENSSKNFASFRSKSTSSKESLRYAAAEVDEQQYTEQETQVDDTLQEAKSDEAIDQTKSKSSKENTLL